MTTNCPSCGGPLSGDRCVNHMCLLEIFIDPNVLPKLDEYDLPFKWKAKCDGCDNAVFGKRPLCEGCAGKLRSEIDHLKRHRCAHGQGEGGGCDLVDGAEREVMIWKGVARYFACLHYGKTSLSIEDALTDRFKFERTQIEAEHGSPYKG